MATFASIKTAADSPSQVRKVVEAVAFLAPYTADPIDTITSTDGSLTTIPTDYWPVGVVTRDGYTFGGDTETDAVDALGYAQPVREDIIGYTRTVTFTAYEVFRKHILALAYAMDLDDVEAITGSGEIVFDRPAMPEQRFYRLVIIGKDGSGDNEIFRAKFFPRVSLVSVPEEAWANEALRFEITLNTYVDDELGTGEREFIGGPAVTAAGAVAALGFKPAA